MAGSWSAARPPVGLGLPRRLHPDARETRRGSPRPCAVPVPGRPQAPVRLLPAAFPRGRVPTRRQAPAAPCHPAQLRQWGGLGGRDDLVGQCGRGLQTAARQPPAALAGSPGGGERDHRPGVGREPRDAPLAPQRLQAPPDGRVGGRAITSAGGPRARPRRHVRSWPYPASPVTHVAGTPAARARRA
jgi:hypothetical protein